LDKEDLAKFLQFVTGTSKVPLQGFAHLEGMNGAQKFQIHRDDRSTDRLPSAHTWYEFTFFFKKIFLIISFYLVSTNLISRHMKVMINYVKCF
jgi:hypothetical protein